MPVYKLGSRKRPIPRYSPLTFVNSAACGAGATITGPGTWLDADVQDTDFCHILCNAYGAAGLVEAITFSFAGTCEWGDAPTFPTQASFTVVVTGTGATMAIADAVIDTRAYRAIRLLSVTNGDASDGIVVSAWIDSKEYVEPSGLD